VFCGSSHGSKKIYSEVAIELSRILLKRKLGLVYGGARVGLMGAIATAVHEHNGEIIGVIPAALVNKEVAYKDLIDLRIVETMHERKNLMFELSDGFVALPGGLGTLDEFFEILTWAQLGLHSKPCGLLNVDGYFDNLITFLHHAVNEQFIESEYLNMVMIDKNPNILLDKMMSYKPPQIDKAERALKKSNHWNN
jgi:uncharacterized protein (TIGR00730 family)